MKPHTWTIALILAIAFTACAEEPKPPPSKPAQVEPAWKPIKSWKGRVRNISKEFTAKRPWRVRVIAKGAVNMSVKMPDKTRPKHRKYDTKKVQLGYAITKWKKELKPLMPTIKGPATLVSEEQKPGRWYLRIRQRKGSKGRMDVVIEEKPVKAAPPAVPR